MTIAITRAVSSAIASCELTHLQREPIDVERARRQHHAYEAALARLGARVIGLPEEPTLPDSVFVEDTAVVLDELAIITRPGAESRRAETASIAEALASHRTLATIEAPATLDGGDVLLLGKTLFVGLSSRSGMAGVEALANIVKPHGYEVRGVPVRGCLHLKSAVTQCAPGTLLFNPAWVDSSHFAGARLVPVDPSEPHAANGLLVGEALVYPEAYPRTLEKIMALGVRVELVDLSELAKAEGAVTCCSLLFASR